MEYVKLVAIKVMETNLHVLVAFLSEFVHSQLTTGVADKPGNAGQQIVTKQPPKCGIDLLPGQITLWRRNGRNNKRKLIILVG